MRKTARFFRRRVVFYTSTDPDLDHAVSYGLDNSGRYGEVAAAGKTFSYTYTEHSQHLIGTVQGPANIVVTNTWDENRDVLSVKNNAVDSVTVSGFTYVVNNLGQRVQVTTAGSAHGWSWGYDARGQVTKATNAANTDYNRAYVFDNIGNRTSATDGTGQTATTVGYTPNDLNQYEEIDPGTPVNPDFDADGNLSADAGINIMGYGLKFEWDAENRITAVRKDVQGSPLLATYTYDYLGRRIRKTTTSSALQGVADIAYVYDGFNVVAEYTLTTEGSSVSEGLLQAYTWGLDLSGSMQGAGGVGGLLCIHRSPGIDNGNRTWGATFYPTFDGNGNISEYLDEDGVEVAHFEYDPFGRIVLSTGTPGIFTYRFSTKPQDTETGLYYYGYRYYDPLTGRWPSRDPIEEEGGMNLYGFVRNDGIDAIDNLGLDEANCGCFTITAKFNEYKAVIESTKIDAGINVELEISAKKTGKCACSCKKVKIFQMVKDTGVPVSAARKTRTSRDGWRIDTSNAVVDRPFVSDSPPWGKVSGMSGTLIDKPRFRKINGSKYKKDVGTFEAYTCLICAEEGPEKGNVLGCASWGFQVTNLTGDVQRKVELYPAKASCPNDAHSNSTSDFMRLFIGARDKWNEAERLKWDNELISTVGSSAAQDSSE